MIRKMGMVLTRLSLKYVPDPSIFAVLLTFVAFILGITIANNTPMQMVINWYDGFWSLLTFSMQMALMVITASTIANAPIAKRWIRKLASVPSNSKQAVFLVTIVSTGVALVHWGLSLILGALLAKEVAKSLHIKKIPFEYGLIGAGAYVGQMMWHGGMSASVGLLIATPGHFLEEEIGIITMSDYMFNPMNLVVTLSLVILPPLFAILLHPKKSDEYTQADEDVLQVLAVDDEIPAKLPGNPSIGDRLNHSRIINIVLGGLGLIYVVYHFATKGFSLDLNIVNSTFLFAGILMHGTVYRYVNALKTATVSVSGIIFQFPLYAGIMGMVRFSGMVDIFAQGLVDLSSQFTFPLWMFLTASLVNIFVPSGGGQWAVMGPIAIKSAEMIDYSVIKTALCVAYGNTWTNMLQPFWAIALLGITGLKARDILGYSISIMLLSGLVFILGVLFLPV
ncbi:MAG: TIGR00366 family protein [Clostridia bacterium]|nr:TIGR00366 family protein [Clostridia bacterium]